MHELSIMSCALDQAIEQTRAAGGSRIFEVRLRVGALSGAVPEALEFAFEAVTSGTMAEGARLRIESIPAKFWCDGCAREFEAEDLLGVCSECGVPSPHLRSGRELEIASLEIN